MLSIASHISFRISLYGKSLQQIEGHIRLRMSGGCVPIGEARTSRPTAFNSFWLRVYLHPIGVLMRPHNHLPMGRRVVVVVVSVSRVRTWAESHFTVSRMAKETVTSSALIARAVSKWDACSS